MNRRYFLRGAAAFAAASNVSPSHAQSRSHPLSQLIDINTGRNFEPQLDRFSVALFMTAEQRYPSCGAAFIGIQGVIDWVSSSAPLQPVLIMPKFKNQPDPSRRENLASVTDTYANLNFTILTGELDQLRDVSEVYGDPFTFDNARSVVSDHTLDAFLLKPQSGGVLLRYRADDYYNSSPIIQDLINGCKKPENASLCI
ncbi:MAG: hypothetical protein GW778_01845 [Alphaproteobacteria bacterium]|nr:hypothetical protein [Alphaproteobacteria bacterium]